MNILVMSGFVCGVIVISVLGFLKYNNSSKWKNVAGKIEASSFERLNNRTIEPGSMGDSVADFKITVSYSYIIDGETKFGNTLRAGLPNVVDTKNDAEELMMLYRAGNGVQVFYNPANTAQSALNKSIKIPLLAVALFVLLIASIGGGIIWYMNYRSMAISPFD